jgi:hypothetical protein
MHPDKPNEALVVLRDEVQRDAGSCAACGAHVPFRDDTNEAPVAFGVRGEQDEMVGGRVFGLARAFACPVARNVDLATENRADAGIFACFVKLNRPEHVAVVGEGHGAHAKRLGFAYEVLDFEGPVEQRVLRVYVEMNELGLPRLASGARVGVICVPLRRVRSRQRR